MQTMYGSKYGEHQHFHYLQAAAPSSSPSINRHIITSLPPVIVSTSLSDPSDDRLLVVGELAIEYLHLAVLYKPYLIAYTGDEELIMTDDQDATMEGFECIG